ncbi:biotin-dependent carboxyltransferase family protein [Herbaspirillum chlorophenolicum]|uniref:5-oxoprolinase subunit C family protein n=1 Tax=Herbaspirillum chlorophenolicum TaxID=211589 RepID=UPI00067DB528|nr:biotin-dependent carboxyltransferase family protein [Herbaspirillum chlorophenolicum]
MNLMHIDRAGMYCTLQDLGRYGFQQYGVPVNGPMDEWAHRAANALVGNAEDAAVLECTLTGPALHFSQDTLVALTGADMRATVDGRALPRQRAVMVRRQAKIELLGAACGTRAYLAVRGGFATGAVMGSRSTYVRGRFGGMEGRPLQRGDRVPAFSRERGTPPLALERTLVSSGLNMVAAAALPEAAGHWIAPLDAGDGALTLRCIPGPHWQAFSEAARASFTAQAWRITPQSDRMGYRLDGAPLDKPDLPDMISEATCFGTVQVPAGGHPIVLMADRQSAGGYPKIAYVAAADLPLLAQAGPGTAVRFVPLAQAQAEKLWLQCEDRVQALRDAAQRTLASN